MWYFWIDQHRKGEGSAPNDKMAKIHLYYTGELLGGGIHPLKTVCGRKFFPKESNIIGKRAIRQLRGMICKRCFPAMQAEAVAERFMQ